MSWMWCFRFCYFVSYFGAFRLLCFHIVHPVKGKVSMFFFILSGFNLNKLFWFTVFTDCGHINFVELENSNVRNKNQIQIFP